MARFVFSHAGSGEPLTRKQKRILFLSRFGETLANELVQTRCERGADMARGIYSLNEHWNGKGRTHGLAGFRIVLLAQIIDVFFFLGGKECALAEVVNRSGRWFDPELVDIFRRESQDPEFWRPLHPEGLEERVWTHEPDKSVFMIDDPLLDRIAEVFSRIIDVKSRILQDPPPFLSDKNFRSGKIVSWQRRSGTIRQRGDFSDVSPGLLLKHMASGRFLPGNGIPAPHFHDHSFDGKNF